MEKGNRRLRRICSDKETAKDTRVFRPRVFCCLSGRESFIRSSKKHNESVLECIRQGTTLIGKTNNVKLYIEYND